MPSSPAPKSNFWRQLYNVLRLYLRGHLSKPCQIFTYKNDCRLTRLNQNCDNPIRFGTPACQIPQTCFLNSKVTELIFTTFSHDVHVEVFLPLLIRAYTKRCCILFRNARAKSKDAQFWCLQKSPKVNQLPQQRPPFEYHKTFQFTWVCKCWNVWWSSVQYLLRYLVRYVDFCHLVWKDTETACVISEVSGPITIKLAQM